MSRFAWLAAALFLTACKGEPEAPTEGAAVEAPATTAEGEVIGEPGDGVITAIIRPLEPFGAVAQGIVVQLDEDVFPDESVGHSLPMGTELSIEPVVEGTWRVTDRDQLTFTPAEGARFAPATAYTVALEALSVTADDGTESVVAATPELAWSRTFTTAGFEFLRMSLAERDEREARVAVDLVFGAPVSVDGVRSKVSFTLDGKGIVPGRIEAGPDARTVRATFLGRSVMIDGELAVKVAAGVPLLDGGGVVAPAGQSSVKLRAGKPLKVLGVAVREGVNGHYVDVICYDEAVGGERWWWDRDTYDGYYVSSRCLADEASAKAAIRISPPVEVTVSQSPGGFRLFGDFARGAYEIELGGGLTTVDGAVLASSQTHTLDVRARTPRVTFASKGRYLPRSAWHKLAVRHLNVDALDLTVRHVPEQNLAFWMSGDEPLTERTSNVVLKKKLAVDNQPDAEATTWIDVGSLLPDVERGVYELTVAAEGKHDSSRLLLTDMHLVAKRAMPDPTAESDVTRWTPDVRVWALDVHTNRPLSGVDVRLVRPSGENLATCRTDGTGGCMLAVPQDEVDTAGPMAVIAQRSGDLTYLKFDELRVRSEDDVSGLPYKDVRPYRAAVQLDRGVYRPGDTAHVTAIVRDAAFKAPSGTSVAAPGAGLPVVVKVFDPRGKELRRAVVQTNAAGMLVQDVPFADFATTGRYRLSLEVADREIGAETFNVEEFVPERMAVEAGSATDGYLFSDSVPVDVGARWLFGGSAKGSRAEVSCELEPVAFAPPESDGYTYGLAFVDRSRPRPVTLGQDDGVLDDDGAATLRCPAALASGGTVGAARVVARVSVFEGDSGRTTQAIANIPVHPEPYYVGLRSDTSKVEARQVVKVQGRLADWKGKATRGPAKVDVRVMRMDEEYGWWWDEETDDTEYRRLLRRVPVFSETMDATKGSFAFDFTVDEPGAGYLVEASAGDTRTELFIEGDQPRYYWDPWESYVDQTPRPQKPTPLTVHGPESIEVGRDVTVSLTAPFAGRLLWTVETDHVVESEWVEVKPGEVTWEFEVEDFAPNVYVGALLLKDPHLESAEAFLPGRAFGVRSIDVAPAAFTQQVELNLPDEVRPYSPLEIEVALRGEGKGPRFVTVAAVDEGILSLTGFPDPDPLGEIFARRALGVESFETVGWTLLHDPAGPSSHTGGDEEGAGGGRVQAVKPVALWSGLVEVPASGRVKVSLDVPGYRGTLRVMAVAAGEQRLGAATKTVVVRDPIVLQTTIPRFLVQGDVAQIPVFVANMSGGAKEVTVKLQVEELAGHRAAFEVGGVAGPVVELLGKDEGDVSLADGESDTVVFQVTARRVPAAARIRVTATSGSLVSKEELELPLVPANPEVRRTARVALSEGSNDLTSAVSGWVPGSDRTNVWVTHNPYAEALGHLQYLVRYPYGCIEQTTSSTRPLLFVGRLVDQLDLASSGKGSVEDMVAHGVDRVFSMQTPSGGFGYWPGSREPHLWGTAYAMHMLLDAREAGFQVSEPGMKDALDYLERNRGNQSEWGLTTAAYVHYVLARGGRGHTAEAVALVDQLDKEWTEGNRSRFPHKAWYQEEARYLLEAAAWLGGDRRYENELRDTDTRAIENTRYNDWAFRSELRTRALKFAVYQDLFGAEGAKDTAGEAYADSIAKAIVAQSSRRYTTQELSWSMTGLGKRIQKSAAQSLDVALTVDGKAVKSVTEGEPSFPVAYASAAKALKLDVKKGAGRIYAVVSSTGVPTDEGLEYGAHGLQVSREYVDMQGRPLNAASQALGDQLYVRVTVLNTGRMPVNNVALVDRIPAGWEIENPRLNRALRPDWVDEDDQWDAEHMNVRDDRLEIFGKLERGEKAQVVYSVRAVTSGTFTQPPLTAEAMYDPDIWGRARGVQVEISGPWEGMLL